MAGGGEEAEEGSPKGKGQQFPDEDQGYNPLVPGRVVYIHRSLIPPYPPGGPLLLCYQTLSRQDFYVMCKFRESLCLCRATYEKFYCLVLLSGCQA